MIIEENNGGGSGNDSASNDNSSAESPQRPDTTQHKPETIVVIRGDVGERLGNKPERT